MSNRVRQEHFTTAISQLGARLNGIAQASQFEQYPQTNKKVAQMEYAAAELAALASGAQLLASRLEEWAGELLENARS